MQAIAAEVQYAPDELATIAAWPTNPQHIYGNSSGIVGRRKLLFDVWGDAVNFAACMEPAGATGHINVSAEVYERTRSFFEFEPRGGVEAKNKGKVDMFLFPCRA
jgi:hypothetical protein